VYFLWRGHRVLAAAVSFCLALAFKHMALYYAPAFFAYMLAGVMRGKHIPINNSGTGNGRLRLRPSWAPLSTSFVRLALLGSTVLLTLGLMFAPWLFFSSSPLSAMGQVLHRLFPFARGLYEDKVANVWCATSVLVKWHLWFPRESMVRAALGATLAAMSPFVAHVFLRPSRLSFLYALAGSSLSFFLLSFQVHEKSFLLPLLPLVLLSGRHTLLSAWMGLVASFSMWPLLTRDGQGLNYAVLQGLFAIMSLGFARNQLMAAAAPTSPSSRSNERPNFAARLLSRFTARPLLLYRVVQCSLLGCMLVHLVAAYGLPAAALARWPDLASMLFVLYAAPHFVLLYAILLVQQWSLPQSITEDEDLQPLLRDDVGAAAEGPPQPSHKREEEAVPNAAAVTATPSKNAQVRQRRK
jgi:alpha-1,3-glucosyltransferase